MHGCLPGPGESALVCHVATVQILSIYRGDAVFLPVAELVRVEREEEGGGARAKIDMMCCSVPALGKGEDGQQCGRQITTRGCEPACRVTARIHSAGGL